jgi:hypothetical protein
LEESRNRTTKWAVIVEKTATYVIRGEKEEIYTKARETLVWSR